MAFNQQPDDLIQRVVIQSDEQSAQQAIADLGDVRQQIQAIGGDIQQLSAITASGFDPSQVVQLDSAVAGLNSTYQQTAAQLDAIAQKAAAAGQAQQSVIRDIGVQSSAELPDPSGEDFGLQDDFGVGDDSGGGGGFGRSQARGLRYALGGLPGGQDIAGIVQATSYLGPVGGVLAGIADAAGDVIKNAQDAAAALNASADAYDKVAAAASLLTSQQIQVQVDQAKADVNNAQNAADLAQTNLSNYRAANPLLNALPGLNPILDSSLQGFELHVTDTAAALTTAQNNLSNWEQQLHSSTTATNDWNSALKTLEGVGLYIAQEATKGFKDNFGKPLEEGLQTGVEQAFADQSVFNVFTSRLKGGLESGIEQALAVDSVFAELGQKIVGGISDAVSGALNENLLGGLFDTNSSALANAGKAAQQADTDQRVQIVQQSISYNQGLFGQVRSSGVPDVTNQVNALADEQKSLETFIPELQQMAQTSQAARDALSQAQDRLGAISDDYQDQITQVLPQAQLRAQQALNQDLASYAAQAQQQQVQDYTQFQSKMTDIAQQGAIDQQNIALSNQTAIARINQQADQSEFVAKADRDAVAFSTASQTQASQLTAQAQQYSQQEAQETTSLSRQRTQEYNSYLQAESQLNSTVQRQDQTRIQAYDQQESQLSAAMQNIQQISAQGYGGIGQVVMDALSQSQPNYFNAGAALADALLNGFNSRAQQSGLGNLSGLFNSPTPLPPPSNGGSQGAAMQQVAQRTVIDTLASLYGVGGNRIVS